MVMLCSNSGFTGEALRKSARVGIPALAALIEGDKRVRVVVREQIYTRKVNFLRSASNFNHQNLSQSDRSILVEPLYTREYLYYGQPIEPWFAEKWIRLAFAANWSRAVYMRFTFQQALLTTVRGLHLFVTSIDLRAEFTVQWMTQIVEIGASSGMYDYLQKQVVFGPGSHQFHLKNINTQTWGQPIDIDQVPPRLLNRVDQNSEGKIPQAAEYMTFASIEGLPGGDPKGAPNLDPLLAHVETRNDEMTPLGV
jgi:hypothetical protein